MSESLQRLERCYMTFSREEHPFRRMDYFQATTQELEVFTSMQSFSASAQRYTDSRSGAEEFNRYLLDILALLDYLYWNAYEQLYVPNIKAQKRKERAISRGAQPRNGNAEGGSSDSSSAAAASQQQQQDQFSSDHTEVEEERLARTAFFTGPHIQNRGEDSLFAVMETKPHYAVGRTAMAGVSLRICSNNAAVDFGSKLNLLFADNEGRIREERRGRKPLSNPMLHHKITFEYYKKLVEVYTGRSLRRDEQDREHLFDRSKPLHPCNAFSTLQACALAYQAGAERRFSDINSYRDASSERKFPDSSKVYLLKHEYLVPEEFFKYMWPHIRKPMDTDEQKSLYVKMFVQSQQDQSQTETPSEDEERDRLELESEVADVYDQYMRCRLTAENAMDINALRARMKRRHQHALLVGGGDFNKTRIARRMAQEEGLHEFRQLFHKDGDLPDTVKAIAAWGETHLNQHRNFCMPMRKQSSNLTRMADVFCSMAAQQERTFRVHTMQANAVAVWLSAVHVYSGTKFHCNNMFFGPPRTGKSKIFEIVMEMLIKRTYRALAYETAKATTAPGKKNSQMIEFNEEANPSQFGMLPAASGGKKRVQAGAGTDQAAMKKLQITSGVVGVSALVENKNMPGSREEKYFEADVEIQSNVATNSGEENFESAMLSRYARWVIQYRERQDSGGLMGKVLSESTPDGEQQRQDRVYRMQRYQYLVCMIFYMIKGGLLQAINMKVPKAFMHSVMMRVKASGLVGDENVRDVQRVLFLITVCVLVDVVDMLWDSEVSPFHDQSFEWRHMLIVEPYLVATFEHCTFALGLLHFQFESDVLKNVVRALKLGMYAKAIQAEQMDMPHPDIEDEADATEVLMRSSAAAAASADSAAAAAAKSGTRFVSWTADRSEKRKANADYEAQKRMNTQLYYVIEYPAVQVTEKRAGEMERRYTVPEYRQNQSREELLQKLSQKLYLSMSSPRPQMQSIYHALEQLMEMPIKNEQGVVTGAEFAFQLAEGRAYLSKQVVAGLEAQSLKKIVQSVLEDMTMKPREYLWGVTFDNRPYIWDLIYVRPKRTRTQVLEIVEPNYYDEEVLRYDEAAGLAGSVAVDTDLAPTTKIDGDVENWAAMCHLYSIYTNAEDMEGLPSVFPRTRQREILHAARKKLVQGSSLIKYPESFPKDLADAKSRLKRKQRESEMSVSAKTRKLREELGFEPEEDDDNNNHEADDDGVSEEGTPVAPRQWRSELEVQEEDLLASVNLDEDAINSMAEEIRRGLNTAAAAVHVVHEVQPVQEEESEGLNRILADDEEEEVQDDDGVSEEERALARIDYPYDPVSAEL